MFKLKRMSFVMLVILFMAFALPVHADMASCTGIPDSSGNCPIQTDEDRLITFPGGGKIAKYERVTTTDTLTNVESGTTYLMAPATGSPVTMNLPSATAGSIGMEFTFIADDIGATATGTNKYFWINPSDLDFIVYMTTASDTLTMAAGDKLSSGGTTGDSIHLICGKALYWYATDVRGTWSDAGTTSE